MTANAVLSDADTIRMELRAACSIEFNKILFDFVGPPVLYTASEDQLLSHNMTIYVKGLHKEVHRVNFGKLRQGDSENFTHFVARLRAQAALCSFTVTCSCHENVSFAEEMVAMQLVAGLRDQEHSTSRSKASSLTTLHLKVECLQSLQSRTKYYHHF